MNKFLVGSALAVLATSGAYAQSAGSDAIEQTIVITGSRTQGVGGIVIPDVPKTRSIITAEMISQQSAGQSALQIINQIPGVNFTNNDPYGSSGGNLRVRGFSGNRVALLWDGLPLNDTGNYAIYSNQQMDSELIDQIQVNLGTTDVDSPTPSAAGGIVSYRTIVPSREFGAFVQGSFGDFNYGRISGMLQTGEIGSTGIRAFVQASTQKYDKFRGPGSLAKDQFNARIYKPLGTNGDYVSLAAHYNRNRNASYNQGLASDFAANRYFDNNALCARDPATRNTADNDGNSNATGATTSIQGTRPTDCTNYYGLRINPSNTGNVRGSARYTISDHLIVTIDPGYQYTMANGGGTATISETDLRLRNGAAAGVDLNGDTDILDTVRLYNPSTTRTNRYTFLSSLIYQLNDMHRFRVAYTFDRGEHRQTAQYGYIDEYGNTLNVFGGKRDTVARVRTATGTALNNRDRYSIAQLNQFSGEYFGKFLDEKLTVTAGVRAPFFERKLNQYCYTQLSTGNPTCGASTAVLPSGFTIVPATFANTSGAAVPATAYYAPFRKNVKYNPILPSGGVTFNITPQISTYASYGRNFSSPSTDNLYRSVSAAPKAETTDAYEAGARFRSTKVQAQVSLYHTDYQNRIVSAQDVDPSSPSYLQSIDRNVGKAKAQGFDVQVAVQPIRFLDVSGFLAYTDTEIKNDIATTTAASTIYTGGKQFVETPKWQFGGRAAVNIDPVTFAVAWKHTGKRWSTDDNGTGAGGARVGSVTAIDGVIAADGRTAAYDVVDLFADISLERFGLKKSFLSLSVTNLFDKYYLGSISTQATLAGNPRYHVGSPRTFQGTVRFGF